MGEFSGNWAVIAAHKYLPDPALQVRQAREWGVAESWLGKMDVSAMVVDDATRAKRSTSWKKQLPERADFLRRIQVLQIEGDTVFFSTPLCVGWSVRQAKETIEAVWDASASVYVHSEGLTLSRGDNLDPLLALISKQANAAAVAAHRSEVDPASAVPFSVAKSEGRKPKLESGPIPKGHCVYRFYGAADLLLYVGSTANYVKRRAQHRAQAPWFGEVVRSEVEPFDSLRAALDAETLAIWEEDPVYNVRRNKPRNV